MKQYTNPYDLINDSWSAVLDILNETEQDYLRHVLDYEAMSLVVHDGLVDVVDDITGDVLSSDPVLAFITESVRTALFDAE